MVRRGMEMLVGGEPINADPLQQYVEGGYDFALAGTMAAASSVSSTTTAIPLEGEEEGENASGGQGGESGGSNTMKTVASSAHDWAVATLNSRDFGPLLHGPSVSSVTDVSRGLYCKHWVHSADKWKICPRDLQEAVKVHRAEEELRRRKWEDVEQERAESIAYVHWYV